MDTILQQDTKLALFGANWEKTNLPFDTAVLEQANTIINTLDFPTTKVERWKYTRVTKISNKTFTQDKTATIQSLPTLPLKDAYNVVFVNGVYDARLSTTTFEAGLSVQPIDIAEEAKNYLGKMANIEDKVFAALNTAFATSGAFIKIDAKKVVEKPIQLVFISTGEHKVANLRNVVVADKFSQARITQVFLSENANECFTNSVSEYFMEENAHLVVDKIQYEGSTDFHIALDYAKQPQNTTFKINTVTLNGLLVRNDVVIDVNGQNSIAYLNGAYILKDNQHVDNHTFVNHYEANCESHEKYRGVIDDKATAVFNGMIYVHPHAQKIDSYQSNGNVLLSDTASVNSKPELEIYADDVKCSHGSTIGQLDEEAIYYLRARGISKKSARALMVSAFIGDALDGLDNEELVDYIHDILEDRFGWTF